MRISTASSGSGVLLSSAKSTLLSAIAAAKEYGVSDLNDPRCWRRVQLPEPPVVDLDHRQTEERDRHFRLFSAYHERDGLCFGESNFSRAVRWGQMAVAGDLIKDDHEVCEILSYILLSTSCLGSKSVFTDILNHPGIKNVAPLILESSLLESEHTAWLADLSLAARRLGFPKCTNQKNDCKIQCADLASLSEMSSEDRLTAVAVELSRALDAAKSEDRTGIAVHGLSLISLLRNPHHDFMQVLVAFIASYDLRKFNKLDSSSMSRNPAMLALAWSALLHIVGEERINELLGRDSAALKWLRNPAETLSLAALLASANDEVIAAHADSALRVLVDSGALEQLCKGRAVSSETNVDTVTSLRWLLTGSHRLLTQALLSAVPLRHEHHAQGVLRHAMKQNRFDVTTVRQDLLPFVSRRHPDLGDTFPRHKTDDGTVSVPELQRETFKAKSPSRLTDKFKAWRSTVSGDIIHVLGRLLLALCWSHCEAIFFVRSLERDVFSSLSAIRELEPHLPCCFLISVWMDKLATFQQSQGFISIGADFTVPISSFYSHPVLLGLAVIIAANQHVNRLHLRAVHEKVADRVQDLIAVIDDLLVAATFVDNCSEVDKMKRDLGFLRGMLSYSASRLGSSPTIMSTFSEWRKTEQSAKEHAESCSLCGKRKCIVARSLEKRSASLSAHLTEMNEQSEAARKRLELGEMRDEFQMCEHQSSETPGLHPLLSTKCATKTNTKTTSEKEKQELPMLVVKETTVATSPAAQSNTQKVAPPCRSRPGLLSRVHIPLLVPAAQPQSMSSCRRALSLGRLCFR